MSLPIFKDNDQLNIKFWELLEKATTTAGFVDQQTVVKEIETALEHPGYKQRFAEMFAIKLFAWISTKKVNLIGTDTTIVHQDLEGASRIYQWITSEPRFKFNRWKFTEPYPSFKELYTDAIDDYCEIFAPLDSNEWTAKEYIAKCWELYPKYRQGFKEYVSQFPDETRKPLKEYYNRSAFSWYMHYVCNEFERQKMLSRQILTSNKVESARTNTITKHDALLISRKYTAQSVALAWHYRGEKIDDTNAKQIAKRFQLETPDHLITQYKRYSQKGNRQGADRGGNPRQGTLKSILSIVEKYLTAVGDENALLALDKEKKSR